MKTWDELKVGQRVLVKHPVFGDDCPNEVTIVEIAQAALKLSYNGERPTWVDRETLKSHHPIMEILGQPEPKECEHEFVQTENDDVYCEKCKISLGDYQDNTIEIDGVRYTADIFCDAVQAIIDSDYKEWGEALAAFKSALQKVTKGEV